MTPQEQAHVFAAMMCCGASMGVVYDIMTPLRRIRGLCDAGDLIFGMLGAAGIIAAALVMRTEAFRLYVFAGTGLGFVLYMLTVGFVFRRLMRGIDLLRRKNREN